MKRWCVLLLCILNGCISDNYQPIVISSDNLSRLRADYIECKKLAIQASTGFDKPLLTIINNSHYRQAFDSCMVGRGRKVLTKRK